MHVSRWISPAARKLAIARGTWDLVTADVLNEMSLSQPSRTALIRV